MIGKQINILLFVSDSASADLAVRSQSQTAMVAIDDFAINFKYFEGILQEIVANKSITVVSRVDKFDEVLSTLYQSTNIDAVILDLLLQDELEQISQIHQLFPHIAIIAVGDWDDRVMGQVIEVGGDDYLIKSQMTPLLLRRSLLSAVARRKRQQEDIAKCKQSE